jgi:putative redox protein
VSEATGEAAPPLHVHAVWRGGLAAEVHARGHRIAVDEPVDGGDDSGAMPTELLCAALASCFCLAVGHVAAKRGIELPDLRVDVRAERDGRALRYGRFAVTASSSLPAEELAALVERAERFCWVSNTLAAPPTIELFTHHLTATPEVQ